jgi:hypothetical protein
MDFDFKKVGLFFAAFVVVLVFLFNASNYSSEGSVEEVPAVDSLAVDSIAVDTLNLGAAGEDNVIK